MIRILNDFFLKDIGWKLLALVSAVLLWFVVYNIDDTLYTRTITKPITLVHEDVLLENGFIITNKDKLTQSVSIKIQAKRSIRDNLSTFVSAYVDLSSLITSTNSNRLGEPINLPIKVEVYTNAVPLSQKPESIIVIIDRIITQPSPVLVIIEGEPKQGFECQNPTYQDVVEVTGPKSVVDTVASIRTVVSVKDADKDVEIQDAPIYAYNADGKDITESLTLSVESIAVKVPVYQIKTVPIKPSFEGSPNEGYWVSSLTVEPETIDLVGPQEELDSIVEIALKPVIIDGDMESKVASFSIRELLTGKVAVRSTASDSVIVRVEIDEEAVKDITIPSSSISIIRDIGNFVVQIPPEPVKVTIRGPADEVEKINSSNLLAELDLSGLSQGIHDVALHFELSPKVVKLGGPVMIRVVINERTSTATIFPSGLSSLDDLSSPDGNEALPAYDPLD
ncbi:MAG: hypothetical protein LBU32_05855 [Clostridiales bacterium]|nr:hypothetical protein [Clostridiales bacterium]